MYEFTGYANDHDTQDEAPTSAAVAMILAGRTRNINLFDPTPLSHLPDGKLPPEIPDEDIQDGIRRASAIIQDLADVEADHQLVWSDLGLPGHIEDWRMESQHDPIDTSQNISTRPLEPSGEVILENTESYL